MRDYSPQGRLTLALFITEIELWLEESTDIAPTDVVALVNFVEYDLWRFLGASKDHILRISSLRALGVKD